MRQQKLGAKGSRRWAGGHRPALPPWAPAYNELKGRFQDAVAAHVRAVRLPPLLPEDLPTAVSFEFREGDRHRDPDGILAGAMKIILDGLVLAGILPDDTARTIEGINSRFVYSQGVGVAVYLRARSQRVLFLPFRLPDFNELRQAVELGVRRQLRKAVQP